jgi:predicted transcriptional regulator of viral defense system
MLAEKAITLSLGEIRTPVISKYQFSLIVHKMFREKFYKGESVYLKKNFADRSDVSKYLYRLTSEGVLSPYRSLRGIYSLLGRSGSDPDEIACTVDPFCYVSHLSAMSYHSLTDRRPSKLFISSPSHREWHSLAQRKMEKDLGENAEQYKSTGLPQLVRTKIEKINKTEVNVYTSKNLGAYKSVHGRILRVATVGRTFLDMLRAPDLCGGIRHVLNVFKEYGETYIRLITNEIENYGTPIDKVRAGYILEEYADISGNNVIEGWSAYAQRGGSRKLDPKAEYVSEWSDKWMISLNV